MSSKCASLSMGWENMPLYNVVSPHQIGDIPSKEVARWRSHPIWDESGICNPAWQNSKLFSRRQVPAPRQSGALGSCTEIAYPLKYEACKASPAGWVMSVGTRNPGTCFWRSTWCIQHAPWLTLLRGPVCLSSAHRHDGKCSWPPKSSSDFPVAKFQNSRKMWPVLLTSEESPGGNCSPPLPPPHTLFLHSAQINSSQLWLMMYLWLGQGRSQMRHI